MVSRRGLSGSLQLVCVGQRYKEFLMLRILVENQGRLASGTSMNQERKGGPRTMGRQGDLGYFPGPRSHGPGHGLEAAGAPGQ